jgi:hypothetical protein
MKDIEVLLFCFVVCPWKPRHNVSGGRFANWSSRMQNRPERFGFGLRLPNVDVFGCGFVRIESTITV